MLKYLMICVTFYTLLIVQSSEQTTDPVNTYLEQTTETDDDGTLKLLLFWRVHYNIPCDVRPLVYVLTVDHTLYPHNQFVPIARNDEYNVTIEKCESEDTENTTEVNVTLSLLLNDDVLQHVPYIILCLISRAGYGNITSKVHLPLHTDQCKPATSTDHEVPHRTTGGVRTEVDKSELIDNCVPCNASLRQFQVLQLCIVFILIANMLCEVLC